MIVNTDFPAIVLDSQGGLNINARETKVLPHLKINKICLNKYYVKYCIAVKNERLPKFQKLSEGQGT